ncbi:MAG: hypothetical protein ACE5JH_12205 [Acidobacteriota bacterium]
MRSGSRLTGFFALAALLGALGTAGADGGTGPSGASAALGPEDFLWIYGAGRTRTIDPDGTQLRGIELEWGIGDEIETFQSGGVWISGQEGGGRRVLGIGAIYRIAVLRPGPLRLAPRLRLGLEHRERALGEGFDAFLASGLEIGVWLGTRLEVAIFADREFPLDAGTRNRVGLQLRLGRSL